jgi:hypothetical protein
MTVPVSQLKNEFADREAIRDCMYRYARGIDRLDEELVRGAYWPGAIDHHLSFKGPIEDFLAWSFPMMRAMDQNMHLIANILIRLSGTKAEVESSFYGITRVKNEQGVMRDIIAAGRYLDKFERRGEEWRIAERKVMTDWFREFPDSADWSKGPFGMGSDVLRGQPKPHDMSYKWFEW